MSSIIKQLDNNTINKIAAGEVIESPKSIIKELVENSLDAGSSEIIIEIKNGGKSFIRITDNGSGINKNQIEDAFKRHYTSKIQNAEDLETLHTLGFRGEALASIAAVARVEVVTRTADEDYGTRFVVEGGKTIANEDIGCPVGTTFIVKDLFYNIPARLKFLKSDVSEATKINEIVLCLALSTQNTSFKYINNNKTIFKTPKTSNMINVLSSLYERDLINSLVEVNYQTESIKITGYTSNLNYYRGNRKYQLLFVNGRYVKHNRANFFIEAAYNTLLPKDKHPACFLCIEVNTKLIDVNVHPAKTEIRIKEEEKFLNEIKNAIYHALRSINLVKEVKSETVVKKATVDDTRRNLSFDDIFNSTSSIDISTIQNVDVQSISPGSDNENEKNNTVINNINTDLKHQTVESIDLSVDNPFVTSGDNKSTTKDLGTTKTLNDIFSDESLKEFDERYMINRQIKSNGNNSNEPDIKQCGNREFNGSLTAIDSDVDNNYGGNNNSNSSEAKNDNSSINSEEYTNSSINLIDMSSSSNASEENEAVIDDSECHPASAIPELKYIGMLFRTYILCECEETSEFYMIDQHAAHERINYERFLKQVENKTIVLQELLIPEVINLSYEDYYFAINNKEMFEKLGLPIESFGTNDILIGSVPLIFTDKNIKELFYTILDSLKDNKKSKNSDIELRKIIKNACVSSVKSGDSLHPSEINKLISDLSKTESPYTCPHGRPTIIKMTKYEIERMFERIQI